VSRPRPIAERMDAALKNGPLEYYDLARRVFPEDQYPKAWRYQSNGGPPGLVMALSRAIDRHGFTWRPTYPGQSIPGRTIYPRKDHPHV